MNEEKFAKSARTPYIILYSIIIPISIFIIGGGALLMLAVEESRGLCAFLVVMGIFLLGGSIGWLIYFVRLPEYSITYKDGKLKFRNLVECTPLELDRYETKGLGIDGALFGFGRLFVYVNGKKYKLNHVYDTQDVTRRLYEIKVAYAAGLNASVFGTQAGAANNQVATVGSEVTADEVNIIGKEEKNG